MTTSYDVCDLNIVSYLQLNNDVWAYWGRKSRNDADDQHLGETHQQVDDADKSRKK